jgi:hypothetical protein
VFGIRQDECETAADRCPRKARNVLFHALLQRKFNQPDTNAETQINIQAFPDTMVNEDKAKVAGIPSAQQPSARVYAQWRGAWQSPRRRRS